MTATITGLSAEQIQYLDETVRPNGGHVDSDGNADDDALSILARLDSERDGHFDGVYVWIGGGEYLVKTNAVLAVLASTGEDTVNEHLAAVIRATEARLQAIYDQHYYVRVAHREGLPKIAIAAAASISRPTLDDWLED